jgi:glycosidase
MAARKRGILRFQIGRTQKRPAKPRRLEFHIRGDVRDLYDFDDAFFSSTGNVVFANFRAAQEFADSFNRDQPDHLKLSPADLNAAALLDEVLHYAVAEYRANVDPDVIERALSELNEEMGGKAVDRMLTSFLKVFPNTEIYRSRSTAETYLNGTTLGVPNRLLVLEELLVGRLGNENPAFEPLRPLIRDEELRGDPLYERVLKVFARPPKRATSDVWGRTSLIDVLREPARRAPYSLSAQLAFVRDHWNARLSPFWMDRLLMGTGLLEEERHALAMRGFGGGPGPAEVPVFNAETEEENFSPDVDWMPRVIMVAKNILVWLDQLSKKYGRSISRLDEIPEEEIAQLGRWGFNALWLIGVWQRSEASRTLKQWTGNPEAAPSAYALFDYEIADSLGGEEALHHLSLLCRRHGIQLASDMVPNHTGIDSKWIREHPDWFIQLPYPPYPGYSYSGESVGPPEAPVLQIEDRYFDRSDAAVTFRWQDRQTGEERFIYHGNDGTGMPWNDTAQLDFARQDVREAVIQTILHVARLFPIIRFDAAMVLTKKHFHRLWYPAPGSGEGVPSRAAHGMKREAFDRLMPNEFWREVVDRVASEVPDTLLLAEAFWLLEGYFVRTLGMHRVYNSAFMHMLKDEDNAKYKDVIKKTVAFEPEVLKRYVNFMSNPDEETAIGQFGDGDKYFGVSLLMLTLPGLPMFGHGQIEGLREKYGMEYQRAYLDEQPRTDLIARYERELVPIAVKRYLFSQVNHFHLFDFESSAGGVNENVFAFTNRSGDERALILYNNSFESTGGRVQYESLDEAQTSRPNSISEALDVTSGSDGVITCRDRISGLEYVVTVGQWLSEGLPVRLRGYEYRALMDFELVADDDKTLSRLAERLNGSGVPNLEQARARQHVQPVIDVLAGVVHRALNTHEDSPVDEIDASVGERIGVDTDVFRRLVGEVEAGCENLAELPDVGSDYPWKQSSRYRKALELISTSFAPNAPVKAVLVARRVQEAMGAVDEAYVRQIVEGVLVSLGMIGRDRSEAVMGIAAGITELDEASAETTRPIERFVPIVASQDIQDALDVHEFAGTLYFNKERFETFAAAAFCEGVLIELGTGAPDKARRVAEHHDAYKRLMRLMDDSDYVWTSVLNRIRRIRRVQSNSVSDRK